MKNKKLFKNQGKHAKRTKNELPSITRALIKTFGKTYAWGSFIKLFNDAAQFAGPAVMKGLIIFVRSQTSETPQPMFIGYLLAITMYKKNLLLKYLALFARLGAILSDGLILSVTTAIFKIFTIHVIYIWHIIYCCLRRRCPRSWP